jgi:acetyl esterase/lipase
MDVYLTKHEPECALVFIHGGTWVGGDKRVLAARSQTLLDRWLSKQKCMVIMPNFRTASLPGPAPAEVTYFEMITDIAHALAWLYENREAYGLDENFPLYLLGMSSGAHLAALLATDPEPRGVGMSPLQSVGLSPHNINAVFAFGIHAYCVPAEGCVDGGDQGALGYMADAEAALDSPPNEWTLPIQQLKWLFGPTKDFWQLHASPQYHAANAEHVPPHLLISSESTSDPDVPDESLRGYIQLRTGEAYAAFLNEIGVYAIHEHFPELEHDDLVVLYGVKSKDPYHAVKDFLKGLKKDD